MRPLHALRAEASADDGKRAASVLGVGPSPLRATKGGSLRGGGSGVGWRAGGPRRIWPYIGTLFRVFFEWISSVDFRCVFL